MTQPNTERQALRRKSAIQSAVFSTVVQLAAAALLFWAHRNTGSAAVIGVVLALRQRLREIDGGEEDDAAQY